MFEVFIGRESVNGGHLLKRGSGGVDRRGVKMKAGGIGGDGGGGW